MRIASSAGAVSSLWRVPLLIGTASLVIGCSLSSHSTREFVKALVRGEQDKVTSGVRAFENGTLKFAAENLQDDRPISPEVSLPIRKLFGGTAELAPALVSDAVMCLLEVESASDSQEILGKEECPNSIQCEVCNSQVFPLSGEQREKVRRHWIERLKKPTP